MFGLLVKEVFELSDIFAQERLGEMSGIRLVLAAGQPSCVC